LRNGSVSSSATRQFPVRQQSAPSHRIGCRKSCANVRKA
jgi:hypothetical protein